MKWWYIPFAVWSSPLILVAALCRARRNRDAPAPAPPRAWGVQEHGPLPPGDGVSIQDYYFELALD